MLYRYAKFKKHANYDLWFVDHIGYSSRLTYNPDITNVKVGEDYSTYILNIDKGYLDILKGQDSIIYDNDLIETNEGDIFLVKHKRNRKTPTFVNVKNSKIKHSILYFNNVKWKVMGNIYNMQLYNLPKW